MSEFSALASAWFLADLLSEVFSNASPVVTAEKSACKIDLGRGAHNDGE